MTLDEKPGRGGGHRTVHVVDDDEGVRQALGILLLSAGFHAQTHISGLAFLDALPSLDVDNIGCVLTDVRMPGLDGIALLVKLRGMGFMRPVVVMTALGEIATAVRAMKAGAADFIEKPFDDLLLLQIIEEEFAKWTPSQIEGPAEDETSRDVRSAEALRRIAKLSVREREVLDLLVAGKPNKLVAHVLGISQRTAEMHRARLMTRLGVRSLAEALRLAIYAGLAPVQEDPLVATE